MNAPERIILQTLIDHARFTAVHADNDSERSGWTHRHDALQDLQRKLIARTEADRKVDERTEDSFDADDGPGPSSGMQTVDTLSPDRRNAELDRQSGRDDNALEG